MSEFTEEPIEHGVRKRARYDSAEGKSLMLDILREDGGKLSLLLAEHMRSHTQQPRFQPNTLLAVVPLARLPGPAGETPRGA
ncbi:hypothetical protein, partial [Pseudomonas typographi]